MDKEEITKRAIKFQDAFSALKRSHFLGDDHGMAKAERFLLWQIANLGENQPVVATTLANKLGVTLAAVTHHTNSLYEQGYIERTSSQEDRREILITLSEKGKSEIKKFKKRGLQKIRGLMEYLGNEDSQTLINLITKITKYMENIKGEKC